MSDVALHRADSAELFASCVAAKYLCECGHLNRISERRAGTVRFDVADALGIYIGHGQCRGNSGQTVLRWRARCS